METNNVRFLGSSKTVINFITFEYDWLHSDGTTETITITHTEEIWETQGVYDIVRSEFTFSNDFEERLTTEQLKEFEFIILQSMQDQAHL